MIVELLEKKKYQKVLEVIKKIIDIESPVKNVGILYLALYIFKTAKEFNEESRKFILKLLAVYFNQPHELLKILDFAINTSLTGLQQSDYLREITNDQS